jgi:hypothetical protein
MPKSKIFWFDEAVASVIKTLQAWMRHRDCEAGTLASVMGFGKNTWFNRAKKPENLTLVELWKAIDYLKIPERDAVEMLTAGVRSLKTSKKWNKVMEELR